MSVKNTSKYSILGRNNHRLDFSVTGLWEIARIFINTILVIETKGEPTPHAAKFLSRVIDAYNECYKRPAKLKSHMKCGFVEIMVTIFSFKDTKQRNDAIDGIMSVIELLGVNSNLSEKNKLAFRKSLNGRFGPGSRSTRQMAISLMDYYLDSYNETQFYRDSKRYQEIGKLFAGFYVQEIDPQKSFNLINQNLNEMDSKKIGLIANLANTKGWLDFTMPTRVSGRGGILPNTKLRPSRKN